MPSGPGPCAQAIIAAPHNTSAIMLTTTINFVFMLSTPLGFDILHVTLRNTSRKASTVKSGNATLRLVAPREISNTFAERKHLHSTPPDFRSEEHTSEL